MRVAIPGNFGVGGPGGFQKKLSKGLASEGVETTTDWDEAADVVLLIGGTRRLGVLRAWRRRGVPIVHRLDGINWVHRARWPGLRLWAMAEARNQLMIYPRARFASRVVYQSRFIREWWHGKYGPASVPESIIYNGADTDVCTPHGPAAARTTDIVLLVLEGSIQRGQEANLFSAAEAAQLLRERTGQSVELRCVGSVDAGIRARLERDHGVRFLGVVPRERVVEEFRGADLYVSVELNAPCPNSVVEALACGTPVVGFATGALPDLVAAGGGECARYDGDPWRLEAGDPRALLDVMLNVLDRRASYAQAARNAAERRFDLRTMTTSYLKELEAAVEAGP